MKGEVVMTMRWPPAVLPALSPKLAAHVAMEVTGFGLMLGGQPALVLRAVDELGAALWVTDREGLEKLVAAGTSNKVWNIIYLP